MDTTTLPITPLAGRSRHCHSAAFKATVVDACQYPGVSIVGIALTNGINASLAARGAAVGRTPLLQVDAMWLAAEPADMCSGADRLLARVVLAGRASNFAMAWMLQFFCVKLASETWFLG